MLTLELIKRGYNVFYLIYDSAITIKHKYEYPAPIYYLPSRDLLSEDNLEFYHNFLADNKIDIVVNQSGNFGDSALWLNKGLRNKHVRVISVLHSDPWAGYKRLFRLLLFRRNNSFIEQCKRIARVLLYCKIRKRHKDARINHFKYILPLTDEVCMLSRNFYPDLSEIYGGYENKYITIPNPNSFKESDLITNLKRKKQILFIGLFRAEKNLDAIIKIWKNIYDRFPDWEFVILGGNTGGIESRINKAIKKYDRIRMEGFKSPLDYYHQSSILCMSSLHEGWGMVVTEAMQCGVVPIAFNSYASITDIITDGKDGVLVRPFNNKEYECKLCELMSNNDRRENLSISAKESIKRYNIESVVDQWERIFK
ncbi:MAG: glycosyltransferase [bacterium]